MNQTDFSSDAFFAAFQNPGAAWRGKPFWSWNGDLSEAELLRQVHVLKDMGMGGFFMHSRTGLVTEYLGDEWFRLINACADEAEKLGMEAWLYDEDRWPSGTAGGMVTENPSHRLHFVRLQTVPSNTFLWENAPPSPSLLAAFSCDLNANGLDAQNVRPLAFGNMPPENQTVLLFSAEEMAPSPFYNGFTYVDTMSRDATEAFIALTHERYKTQCSDRLGKSIKGIFTDEPHRGAVMTGFSVPNADAKNLAPWTSGMENEYRARFGGDLLEDLPALFLRVDGKTVSPVKWRYMELTQQLFLENFLRPLYDWCGANNLRLTGHVLHEDSLTCQAAMQGSLMRSYEWMHDPGIDILTEGNRAFWAAKQLQSAARQLGQTWLLSELYGCTGWQFDFAAHKNVGDWQAFLGINLRCHHLSWVTMAGEAKRDYPASIGHQSAWWPDYNAVVETYFSRLGLLLSQGERVCDVLVLNPVESVWCQIHAGWADSLSPVTPEIIALETQYRELFHFLTDAAIDFDYGDEEMLGRLGRVENRVFHLGKAAYKTVIVGAMTTMRGTTLALLRDFASRGGRVIFAGNAPTYVDAYPSNAAQNLAQTDAANVLPCVWSADAIRAAVQSATLSVQNAETDAPLEAILTQIRQTETGIIVAVLHTDRDKNAGRVRLRFAFENANSDYQSVEEWDCQTGKRWQIPFTRDAQNLSWETDLPAGRERIFVLQDKASDLPTRPEPVQTTRRYECAGPFAYTLSEPNVLVLDTAEWRLGDDLWQTAQEVLHVDRAIRDKCHLAHRSGEMVQPWFHRKTEAPPQKQGRLEMRFTFASEIVPSGPLFLALQRPDRWSAHINGVLLDASASDGWWVDTAFVRLPVPPGTLQIGENAVVLSADFSADLDSESVYLLGNFGVHLNESKTGAVLCDLPEALFPADLCHQGLAFYGGRVRLRVPLPPSVSPGETATLCLPNGLSAACAKITPLGADSSNSSDSSNAEAAYIAYAPFTAALSPEILASGGFNLELALTRRNTFGPLHQVPLRAGAYGPGNWTTSGAGWADAYQLWPAGLSGPLIVRF